MSGRTDEDDGVAEERLVLDAAMTRRRADDAELEAAVGDPLDDGLRVEDREGDMQLRVELREPAEERERTTPPGPVDAPISSVPVSSPVASSAISLTTSSSSASSRWAER